MIQVTINLVETKALDLPNNNKLLLQCQCETTVLIMGEVEFHIGVYKLVKHESWEVGNLIRLARAA
jgi:hypothetical protein